MKFSKKIYEIQFLRSIAVLFVVFFHLFPEKFIGGYIGVDIFFVISGFLMMKIMNDKSESVIIFYLSRLKRILPTLITVIILVSIFSLFIFLKDVSNNTLLSAFSSIFFYSNFFFWTTTQNYFAIQKNYLPLLHTWSLSLEFQFYLLVPFFYKLIKKYKQASIFLLLSAIFISLLFSYLFIGRSQSFYLLPYRLNEFLLGSLLYFVRKFKVSNFICDTFFFLVLAFLFYFVFTYDQSNFPGIKAFFVCLLIFIVLYFNNFKYAFFLIKNKFIQHIGKISYSLFLLHWPIIVFVNYLIIRQLSLFEKLFLFLVILILSNLLFNLIENFFAKINLGKFKNKIKFFYILGTLFIIISTIIVKYDLILNFRINAHKINLLNLIKNDNPYLLGLKNNRGIEDVNIDKKNILVFGDSHAEDIHFSLKLLNSNYNYLLASNNSGCSEILSQKLKIHWFEKFTNLLFKKQIVSMHVYENCRSQYEKIDQIISNYKIDKIFISMQWNSSEIDNVDFIIKYFLNKNLLDRVFVFSRRLEIYDPERVILNTKSDSLILNNFFNDNKFLYFDINKNLKNKLQNYSVELIDIDQYILENDGSFIFFNERYNEIYYVDSSHFSVSGGKLYVQKFYDNYLK